MLKVVLLDCTVTPVAVFVLSNRICFASVRVYTFKLDLPLAACKKLDSLELRSSFGDEIVNGVY